MRNRIARIQLEQNLTAGGVILADDSLRRRKVGLLAARSDDEAAQITRPMHFLRILDPSLRDKDVVHPDMMAAQDLLAQTQSEAARLLEEEPDVSRIRWQLDERWYAEQGVFLPD